MGNTCCRQSKQQLTKESSKQLSFTAEGENCIADTIILHEPKLEVFLSCLHPEASLYEKVTTRKQVKQSCDNFVQTLKKHSIKVQYVRDVLKLDKDALIELAAKSLKYVAIRQNPIDNTTDETKDTEEREEEEKSLDNIENYINDDYKMSVLTELDLESLIDIILLQPVVEVSSCDINTKIKIEYIKTKPVGNMVFCRDQQITTNECVVIGHLNSSQREFEAEIMKLVFKNLGVNFHDNMPKECRLEGGDFIPLNRDLCLLGVGLRTNFEAAQYLMDNDLLGTQRFAVIHDRNDQNQDRMHLDTVFNVLNHNTVILLDFDSVPDQDININRTVDIYEKNNMNQYELKQERLDFVEFLEEEGYKNIIKVSHDQQLKYIINFLNIGNGNIIAVNKNLEGVINDYFEKNKIKHNISVEFVEFDGIKAMYGAAHCATQVSRRSPSNRSRDRIDTR